MGNNYVYQRKEGIIVTIVIKDIDDKKLDTFKWSERDTKTKSRCIRTIKEKYGIDLRPTVDPELDWLQ